VSRATAAVEAWRLFIALPVPAAAAREVMARLEPYRRGFPTARWLPETNLHLTLLFLGAIPSARVGEIVRLVDGLASGRPAFAVRIGPGGGRARGPEGVAWLGLPEGGPRVLELAAHARDACPTDLTTDPRGPRTTASAHLTVARRASAELIEALRLASAGPLEVAWTVDRVTLFRSHLGRGGALYEPLHEAALVAPAV
jgi:2'-5' RNA ligase